MTNIRDPREVPMIALASGDQPVFLTTSNPRQRCHQRWWTALPAIPATRDSAAYRRLWRHLADHTMNAFRTQNESIVLGNRGFYVEGREDHLVPAFFENFTLVTNFVWLEQLLSRLSIPPQGNIADAAWSYSYSEFVPGKGRPHADIVIMWRDSGGSAVLVIEAKRPRGARTGIGEKDHPSFRHYLAFAAMDGIERRSQALLVDATDLSYLPAGLKNCPSVVTWQELIAIQQGMLNSINLDGDQRATVSTRLSAHYKALGLLGAEGSKITGARAEISRYAELRALDAPASVKDWLVGSELFFAVRNGQALVEAPYEWLLDEPTMSDYAAQKTQLTPHREFPIWHLDNASGFRPH